jgi:UDP-glucose 4-epimerase
LRKHLGEGTVRLVDSAVELLPLAFDPVGRRAALERDLGVDEDEERAVGQEPTRRDEVQPEHALDAQLTRDALVGEGRVDVAVADDDLPGLEGGRDHALDELRARCGEERRLRPGAHLEAVEQEPAYLFTERCAARLAGRDDIAPLCAERVREQVRLRGFSGPVQPFEGEEHRRRTIRRVRAVVTGGAGFIGSHIVDALLARGDEVQVLDDLSSGRNVVEGAQLHKGDVRRDTEAVFAAARPDVCFHLAAQIDVRVSVERPDFDADVNVGGTLRVLEAARKHGAKIVFSSTGGAIYGECDGPAAEDHPRLPLAPYGVSKLAAEEYIAAYNRLYGSGHVSLRYGNVYGPRQDPHGEAGVVAIFMSALRDGGTPRIYGDGTQTRDYVYVGDVVAATLAAGEQDGGVFNVGTGVETSVLDLYERIQRAAGHEREPELVDPRPGEVQRSVLDPSLAQRDLGWRPAHSLDAGLADTWAWISADMS